MSRVTGHDSLIACLDYAQRAIGRAGGQRVCGFACLLPPCKHAAEGKCERCAASPADLPALLVDAVVKKATPSLQKQVAQKRAAAGRQ